MPQSIFLSPKMSFFLFILCSNHDTPPISLVVFLIPFQADELIGTCHIPQEAEVLQAGSLLPGDQADTPSQ